MPKYSRAELEQALAIYNEAHQRASETGDWEPWVDLFTEDAIYKEHAYGEFHGREEIRQWIVDVMAPYPKMWFPQDWVAFDEENGAIVLGVQNVWPHPTEPDNPQFGFPNWTRLVYAGDGKFSSEEDIYNPFRDAPRVMQEWLEAGGKFAAPLQVKMKYTQSSAQQKK